MPCCCAVGCSNRPEKGFRLFKLPEGPKNLERRKIWLKNIRREGSLSFHTYVCEIHFTHDQFENNRKDGKRFLKWNAVPTLFSHRKIPKPRKPPAKRICLEPTISEDQETISEGEQPICDLIKNTNETTNELDCEDEEQNDKVKELKRKLKTAYKKINLLENKINDIEKNFNKTFSEDQKQFFINESMKGFKWSDETLNKGLKLYMACGKNGYEEIRKQNLPYPSTRTLQKYLQKFKFQPEILDDVLILKLVKLKKL